MYKFWLFVEKILIQSCLVEKYQVLVIKVFFFNLVEVQDVFDVRVNQLDVLLVVVFYFFIVDFIIIVKEFELKDFYNKKKEQFK